MGLVNRLRRREVHHPLTVVDQQHQRRLENPTYSRFWSHLIDTGDEMWWVLYRDVANRENVWMIKHTA